MATLEVIGLAALIDSFDDLANLPDSVAADILNAEADVIVEAQQKTMAEMWDGLYATGETARSVGKSKVKKWKGGKFISVTPQGKNRKGERHAAVAFINEYGKQGQPGRPAIRIANMEAEDKALNAGDKVYRAFLDRKKL